MILAPHMKMYSEFPIEKCGFSSLPCWLILECNHPKDPSISPFLCGNTRPWPPQTGCNLTPCARRFSNFTNCGLRKKITIGGGFKYFYIFYIFFMFTPILVEMIQFDGSHIFQMGWENNHHLAKVEARSPGHFDNLIALLIEITSSTKFQGSLKFLGSFSG